MKTLNSLIVLLLIFMVSSCSNDKLDDKGFPVNSSPENISDDINDGFSRDSIVMKTRPGSILLTGIPQYRLTSIYKVNRSKKTNSIYIGSNRFHGNYSEIAETNGNQWHYNYMPGWEAVYGYNMVNVSHYDTATQSQKLLFEKPVLIKTVYYPSTSKDTLNGEPVFRNFYMVSTYNEDTNKDGFINVKDLRRFYFFNLDGEARTPLIPENYSVISSEYDYANDFMYVYAQFDDNANGARDDTEDMHIFWIDLKDPKNTGRLY